MSSSIRIAILANAAAANREIRSFSSSLDNTMSRFGKMGDAIKNGLALGAVAGVGALGGLAMQGLKTAADMEQADIAFTTMLGSGAKAKSFIAELTAFAAKTPFEFPGLQQSASQLLAAGYSTKQIIPIMTTLGNVTSGMGTGAEGISRASVALQQMNAAQKISAEDLNQLRDAGIPVYDLLSASLGKTKQEVVDMAAKGKLGKEALNALVSGLETGKGLEKFNGLMEKQSTSLTGLWSTVKDTFGMGLAKAIEPAIPAIKKALKKIGDSLPSIMEKVQGTLKAIGPPISDAFNVAKVAAEALWTVLSNPVVQSLTAGVLAIVGAMKVYAIYQAIVEGLTVAWIAAQTALNIVMSANPVGLVVLAIVGLVAALVVAYRQSETFRNTVNSVWAAIKSAVSTSISFITDLMKNIWSYAVTAWNGIKSAATTVWDAIKAAVNVVIAAITLYINTYKAVVLFVFDAIKAVVTTVWDFIKSHISNAVGSISSTVSGFRDTAVGVWNTVRSGAASAWDAVSNKVSAVVSAIVSYIQSIPGKVTSAFSSAGSLLWDAGSRIINGLWDGLRSKWESVKSWFSSVTSQIPNLKGPAAKDAKLLYRNGQLVIQGFKNGLESRYGSVKNSLGLFTDSISATGSIGSVAAPTGRGVVTIHLSGDDDEVKKGRKIIQAIQAYTDLNGPARIEVA